MRSISNCTVEREVRTLQHEILKAFSQGQPSAPNAQGGGVLSKAQEGSSIHQLCARQIFPPPPERCRALE